MQADDHIEDFLELRETESPCDGQSVHAARKASEGLSWQDVHPARGATGRRSPIRRVPNELPRGVRDEGARRASLTEEDGASRSHVRQAAARQEPRAPFESVCRARTRATPPIDGSRAVMFPVRCYSCNKVLGHLHDDFVESVANGSEPPAVMEKSGVRRMCCRRMFLAHVELTHDNGKFANDDIVIGEGAFAVRLCRKVDMERTVSCD